MGDQTQLISRERLESGVPFEAPRGELESAIADVFAESFGIDRIGANDDFFDLGGDSLLAQSLAISIAKCTGREFKISLLVDYGTPRKIATLLEEPSTQEPVQYSRPPIFMVHGQRGFTLPRPEFVGGLAPGQKLVMFELPGIRGDRPPCHTIEEIATEYVRQLETAYPVGPILLGGYCTGCLITVEMAVQLADKGRPILQMVLFDPGRAARNVNENFLRSRGIVKPERGLRWVKHQLRYLRHFLVLGRWTDGSLDKDFADARLKSVRERITRVELWLDSLKRKDAVPGGERLSSEARLRLFLAYMYYRPRRFDGAVTVYSSNELGHILKDDRSLWAHILPNREIHVLGETHSEVIKARAATGAKLMQDAFDRALTSRAQEIQTA